MTKDERLFLAITFLFWFSSFIYVPMLTPYLKSIGISYTLIGTVLASYGLMQFLCRLPMGISSDLRQKRKGFVIAGMVLITASSVLFLLFAQPYMVLLARAVAGVAAATWVVFTILFSSYVADRELPNAMGRLSFAVVFAQLLGMALSAWIVEQWGWQAPFWLGAVIGTAGLVLSLFISEGAAPKRSPLKLKEIWPVLKEPLLLRVSFLSILAHSVMFTTIFGFTTDYALSAGIGAAGITVIVFAFMIPHAFATIVSGKWLVPLLGKWGTLKWAFALAAVTTGFMPFTTDAFWLFILLQSGSGFALGLVFPLFLSMAVENIEAQKRATAMGAYQALYAVGMFSGPFLAGMLNAQFGLEAGFFLSTAAAAMGGIMSVKWARQKERLVT